MTNDDRRTHERMPVKMDVTLHLGTGNRIRLSSRDLSAGGLFLECSLAQVDTLTRNDKVKITVHYDDTDESETVFADVVRLETGGVGLRFDRDAAVVGETH